MKDSTRSSAVDSSIDQRGKRLHDPALSNRAFAIFFIVTILIALVLLVAPKARAASATWNGTTNSTWATGTNWSTTPVPGSGNTATFSNAGNGNTTLNLGTGVGIGTILFDTASAAAYTIGSGAVNSQTLTLDNGGAVTMNSTVATNQTFNAAITLGQSRVASTYTFTNNSTTNTLTFAGSLTGNSTTGGGSAGLKTLALTGAGNGTISGIIGNGTQATVGVTKSGAGTWTLSGANTYTALTTVTSTTGAGKLFINGNSSAATGAVNVNSGGTTLGGSGITGGAVTVASGSNLSPGATGVGTTADFGTGALTLNSGSFFNVDLNNTTVGTGYDQVSVTGAVSVSGSDLVVTAGAGLMVGDKFFIVANDAGDAVGGLFADGLVTTSGGYVFAINYADNFDGGITPNDISLTVTLVPEPSTWISGALAFGILGWSQRRRITRLGRRA